LKAGVVMFRFFMFMCVTLVFVSGCHERKSETIAVLSNSMTNPYWKTIYQGFQDTALELNQAIYIQTLTKVGDAEEQANQCENALLQKPKAIIFAAVNQVNLISCLTKASAQGIVLVDIDGNFTEDDAKKYNLNVAFSVASNNYDLGKLASSYVKDIKGKALIIEGANGSTPSIRRVSGFRENISKDIEVVASLSANWDMMNASNITRDILVKHPDLKMVFAANDGMALGAVQAIKESSNNDIIVVGVDGNKDAVLSIKEGHLKATVAQFPYLMAKQALEKTLHYLAHPEAMQFNQYVPILVLDKDLFDQNTEPLLTYVQ